MVRRGPAYFRWTAPPDNKSTHLLLETGTVYPVSSFGTSILLEWMKDGKIYLIEGEFDEGTILEVQDGHLGAKDEYVN